VAPVQAVTSLNDNAGRNKDGPLMLETSIMSTVDEACGIMHKMPMLRKYLHRELIKFVYVVARTDHTLKKDSCTSSRPLHLGQRTVGKHLHKLQAKQTKDRHKRTNCTSLAQSTLERSFFREQHLSAFMKPTVNM